MSFQKTMPAAPIPPELPSTARLFVYPSTSTPAVRALDGDLVIGRSPDCNMQIDDQRASGQHARIRRRKDTRRFEVEDLGSTNGTTVNGDYVASAILEHGSVIRVGDTLLVFEAGPRPSSDMRLESIESLAIERKFARVAHSDAPLLILGATGAGKGHFAKRIADSSQRRGKYVHVNCAALPRELVEAELFGYEKGAFTGAVGAKSGLIEEADGGTLFLDEIGTLEPALQAKMLVAVEEGEIRRVGATRGKTVDVRYLAATNVNVHEAIEDGSFREDLYYRLAAQTVTLPALADRRPDIVPIFNHIAGIDSHTLLSGELLEALLIWSWPGNVRELINYARVLQLDDPTMRDFDTLPAPMTKFLRTRSRSDAGMVSRSATGANPLVTRSKKIPARAELEAMLEECGGNVSAMARKMDKHRNQIVRWLDAYGLRP
jgi:transcriptional regulator with PAS, ATPase and Fis domain